MGVLSARVRASRHGVLIRSDCVGACARAPVVLLVRRDGSATGLLYGPVERPDQVGELLRAVDAGTGDQGRSRRTGKSGA